MAYELQMILLVPLLGVIGIILRWIRRRPKIFGIFKGYGIPGPEPNFFTGNMHQLKLGPTPNDVISQWLEQYGNIFGYFIGENPHLVVKDLNFLKQVLIKDFSHFQNRDAPFFDLKPLTDLVAFLEGQRWKDVRGVFTPCFSSSKMKLATNVMDEKVADMVEVVKNKAITNEMFDIYEVAQNFTLDVTADCVLNLKANCLRNPKDPFLHFVRNFFLHGRSKFVEYVIIFPFISRIIYFITKYITVGKLNTMIVNNLKQAIAHRRNTISYNRTDDVLQFLIDAAGSRDGTHDDVPSKNKKVLLSDYDIIANAYGFLLAGYETTSAALGFTFHFLVQHPEIQEKLYDEIVSNLKTDRSPYKAVQCLQYLDQVLNESLRMYPPLAGFVTRKCLEEYKFGNVVIPRGAVIHIPVWDIHHDPELWPDPWKFDPDRFAPENKASISNMSFIPFSAGPRMCLGMRFSQLKMKLAIMRLVLHFKFVSCEKTEDHMILEKVYPRTVVKPANGVYLKAVLRDSST